MKGIGRVRRQQCKVVSRRTRLRELFCKHYEARRSGRFVVRLPFHENKTQLGQSREIAIKRLTFLERKLRRNPKLCGLYSEFMREYIELNYMSKITKINVTNPVYLPHHGVFRESSTTSRLRGIRCVRKNYIGCFFK